MVQANPSNSNKQVILVLGTLGIGKSTFLNKMGGTFETSDEPEGCTQGFQINTTNEDFELIDAPGLNDADIPLTEWAARLNTNSQVKGKPINLCLLVFKQCTRPQSSDMANLIVMQEALKAVQPENLACVFTHCDQSKNWNKERAMKWIQKVFESVEELAAPTEERIFNFCATDGQGGSETTQEDLKQWLLSVCPIQQVGMTDDFSFANAAEKMLSSGDSAVVKLMQTQIELMQKQLADQQKYQQEFMERRERYDEQQRQREYDETQRLIREAEERGRKQGRVVYRGGCFKVGTLVERVTSQDIDVLSVATPIEQLECGDKILTVSEDGIISSQPVIYVSRHPAQIEDMVDITLRSGKLLQPTSRHMMVVRQDGTFQLKKAEHIEIGDVFCSRDSANYIVEDEVIDVRKYSEVVQVAHAVVPGYMLVNNIVSSSRVHNDMSDSLWKAGQFIYNTLGAGPVIKYAQFTAWFRKTRVGRLLP